MARRTIKSVKRPTKTGHATFTKTQETKDIETVIAATAKGQIIEQHHDHYIIQDTNGRRRRENIDPRGYHADFDEKGRLVGLHLDGNEYVLEPMAKKESLATGPRDYKFGEGPMEGDDKGYPDLSTEKEVTQSTYPNQVNGLRPTTETGSNPKDGIGALKVPLGAIPPTAQVFLGLAMGEGGAKYGYFNFRVAKVQAKTYIEAALRHLNAYYDGEEFDALTGIPHLGYAMACCAIVSDAWVNGTLIDNRPIAGRTGDLLAALVGKDGKPLTPTQIKDAILGVIENGR